MATEFTIQLPKPHPKQLEFIRSPAKRKVVVAGRRGGKTTGVSMLAVNRLLQGRRILYLAPTQDQTAAFWRNCKNYLVAPLQAGVLYKNETDHILELPNQARIRAKTAWDANTARGDYADELILEEFSLMKSSVWDEVGAPMLLDNDGNATFIFTPQRKNHAHVMYARAVSDDTGRWACWHFTSFDNPYLSPEALAEITADMTEDAYKQEILAMFLDNEGAVFHNIAACLRAPLDAKPEQHKGHRIMAGVDWGDENDFTASSFACADCRVEVALHRERGIGYRSHRKNLLDRCAYWGVAAVLPERNSIGKPNIEDLIAEGLPIVAGDDGEPGFDTLPTTKAPLIELLVLSCERADFQWLPIKVATAELEAYEFKVSPITFKKQYSAPEGVHDDTVIARALVRRLCSSSVATIEVALAREYTISELPF